MSAFDQFVQDALAREVPLRPELEPAWDDVLVRAGRQPLGVRSTQRTRRHGIVASRRTLIGAFAAAAVLIAAGLATASGAGLLHFGPLHRATLEVAPTTLVGANGQISTCNLIGKRADQVATTLASRGIVIEWRYQHWGTVTVSTGDGSPASAAQANAHAAAVAVTGGNSHAVSSVPGDSIVWDASPDSRSPNEAFVFVEAPNDPNAPTISPTGCS